MAKWIAFSILLSASRPVFAYPGYATRYNVIRCTACHLSPVGGGPRTVYGKLFGAHGYGLNPMLQQDFAAADFRVLHYYPQRATSSKGGMGIMTGAVAGHAVLDSDRRVHLVIEHNFGGFQAGVAGLRDTYALYRFHLDEVGPRALDSLLLGRFRAPFGIVTDEHRTYTRIQSATEWFTFETGFMLSGTPTDRWHYDVAMVNGEKSGGQTLNPGQAERWGGIVNARYMPGSVLAGFSASYHSHARPRESRQAYSLYAIASIARITNDSVPVTVNLEHVRAKNWSGRLGQGFVNDAYYAQALATTESRGWLAWVDYAVSPRFALTYKYDWLEPDRDFHADVFERHGFGLRWTAAAGVIVQVRAEFARATHPSEAKSTAIGGQDATWALLQMSL